METTSSLFEKFAWYLSEEFLESGEMVEEASFYPLSKDAPQSAVKAYERYEQVLKQQKSRGVIPD